MCNKSHYDTHILAASGMGLTDGYKKATVLEEMAAKESREMFPFTAFNQKN